jgi:hypothetical protein
MRGGRPKVLAAFGVGLLVFASAIASAPASGLSIRPTPTVLTCLGKNLARPANEVVTCATANQSWRNVTWSRWGAKTATGTGTLLRNDCTPNCAAGHFHRYQARVVLSKPRSSSKGPIFTVASIAYTANGKRHTDTRSLRGGSHVTRPTAGGIAFFSPIHGPGINCEIDYHRGPGIPNEVFCERFTRSVAVRLAPDGSTTRCHGNRCLGDPGENTPTLGYGKVRKVGPFRCLSSRAGMLCTATSGSGFILSRTSVQTIRGY